MRVRDHPVLMCTAARMREWSWISESEEEIGELEGTSCLLTHFSLVLVCIRRFSPALSCLFSLRGLTALLYDRKSFDPRRHASLGTNQAQNDSRAWEITQDVCDYMSRDETRAWHSQTDF
jgi:hypothetical protein